MIIIEANPCEDVQAFAQRLIDAATAGGGIALGEFNQHTLEAYAASTIDEVIAPWAEANWRDYFGDDRLAETRAWRPPASESVE